MLSYSPQGTFMLALFALVVSGLCLAVLLWIRVRELPHASALGLRALAVGLALLVGAFGAQALYCYLTVCRAGHEEESPPWLYMAGEHARLLAAGALVAGYLILSGRRSRAVVVTAVALVVAALGVARLPADTTSITESIVPLTTPRAAEVAVLSLGVVLLGSSCFRASAALALIGAGRGMALVAAAWPAAAERSWAAEQVATLMGLLLLALTLDRESRQSSLRLFLRLNVTFLILATSLILVVTELGRRQFVTLAALHVEDVAEFVRGHTLYYFNRGERADQVLAHDDVLRRVVADFGRYPDLRRVQVTLDGQAMALSIRESGEIEQEFWAGDSVVQARVRPADFAVAPVVRVPIVVGGRPVGSVRLDQSLERINEKIGWQMQVIFAVFTLFVAMASLVTGILMVAAEQTIRRQYTEIERTLRRLSLAERLASIGAVADGVAHELNNPAGILVARTDYLLSLIENSPAYADIREDLDTVRRQAQRIGKTVKGLLSFTRPTPLSAAPVDIRAVLESAAALVRPLAAQQAVGIELHVTPETPPAGGDRDRLEQVLVNLLVNAVQASRAGGRVSVTAGARPDGSGVEVVVRDHGVGILPEHLDRIFDPFFTTKEPGKGTGLGLSIAYGIIRDHGGTIDVTSTPGVGTEFCVRLPSSGSLNDSRQHVGLDRSRGLLPPDRSAEADDGPGVT